MAKQQAVVFILEKLVEGLMLSMGIETNMDVGPHLGTSEIVLQKLLVAIDFSTAAGQALKAAIAIAQCFQSEILLVNAVTPFVYGDAVPAEALDVNLDAAKVMMKELIASEPSLLALRYREIIAYSGAIELVEKVVREHNVDLVIAGSHGASGFERLAMGSVAECILRKVQCPVLIIGPHCKTVLHPFRSVLFATDLKTTGLRAAQYAASLAERFHGKLTLLHVLEPKAERSSVQPELMEDHIRHQLQLLMPADIDCYSPAWVYVEHGRAGEIIPLTAHSDCASLIVTGLRDRSSMTDHSPWSTLSHVIRDAPCPVLIVKRRLA